MRPVSRIVDGSLRFWTPGDPGRDEYGNFLVHTGLGITSLTALIRSQRPTRAATAIEAMENGELPAPRPRLNVEGLGANNSLTGGPLTFRLASNPGGDFKDDSRAELVAAGNSVIALQDYWTYNPADASFTIDTPAMAEILTRLAPGTSSMSVNFVSKDGEFAAVYELLVLRPSASLSGRFISQDGEPVATLSGMHVLLKGYAGSLRKAAVIGSDGRFTFEGLVPDTYQLTLSDLANPNATTASTAVFLDSTNVDVSIVYAKPSAGKAGSQKLAPGRAHGSKSSQDGTPPSRSGADRVIARDSLPSAGQPGEKIAGTAGGCVFCRQRWTERDRQHTGRVRGARRQHERRRQGDHLYSGISLLDNAAERVQRYLVLRSQWLAWHNVGWCGVGQSVALHARQCRPLRVCQCERADRECRPAVDRKRGGRQYWRRPVRYRVTRRVLYTLLRSVGDIGHALVAKQCRPTGASAAQRTRQSAWPLSVDSPARPDQHAHAPARYRLRAGFRAIFSTRGGKRTAHRLIDEWSADTHSSIISSRCR